MKLTADEIDLLLHSVVDTTKQWDDQLQFIKQEKEEYSIQWHSFPARDQNSSSYQYMMNLFNKKIENLESKVRDGVALVQRLRVQKELLHQKEEEQGGEVNVEEC